MHAELDAKLAAASPAPGLTKDFPPIVFDAISIDPSSRLSPAERSALIETIRHSSEMAAPGWLDELQGAYVNNFFKDGGYFRANPSVTSQTLKTDSDGVHVSITVVPNEGPQYRMGKVSFRANSNGQQWYFSTEQLESRFYLKEGDIFAASSIRRTLNDLKVLYTSHGFIDFVATPIAEIRESTRKIDLTLELDEQRRFRVGNVTIETASDKARSAIHAALVPGDPFDAQVLSKILHENAALLPFDVSLEDITLDRHVEAGTVDITLHLDACPTAQQTSPKWINVDQVAFVHPTSLTEYQQAHLVRSLEEYRVPYSDNWLETLQNSYIPDTWKSLGFIFVKVNVTARILKADADGEHVALMLDVNEGVQYTLDTVTFAAEKTAAPLSLPESEIGGYCQLKMNAPFDQSAVRNCLVSIRGVYRSHGNSNVVVTPVIEMNQAAKRIGLIFLIDEAPKPTTAPQPRNSN